MEDDLLVTDLDGLRIPRVYPPTAPAPLSIRSPGARSRGGALILSLEYLGRSPRGRFQCFLRGEPRRDEILEFVVNAVAPDLLGAG